MMYKKVLLLVVLVAFLVVPGAAATFGFPDSLASGDLTLSGAGTGSLSISGGYINMSNNYGTTSLVDWAVPTGSLSGDFSITGNLYPKSSNGACYLYLIDSSGNPLYGAGKVFTSNIYHVIKVGESTDRSAIGPGGYSSAEISRSDGVVTVRVGELSRTYSDTRVFDSLVRVHIGTHGSISLVTLWDGNLDVSTGEPCTINIYDSDTRLPLSGSWDYYVVIQGADAVSGSASGAFKAVNLPKTSILQPHLLRVTKEGYEHVGSPQMVAVPAGGCEVKVYLRDMQRPAAAGNVMVTFACTDADSGAPVHSALVNLNGTTAQYTGSSGLARFEVLANSTMKWVASSGNHWPMGGDLVVGTEDVTVPVALVRKTSELPRPPLPELPNFPVIHPSLDPAGFRMQILSVPLLGSLASPLLDTVDSLGVGLNGMATAVLDVLTAPADYITGAVSSVGQNLIDTATPYLVTSSLLLQVIGAVISCIPEQVCGLVTFGLLLDIARILLWGPA